MVKIRTRLFLAFFFVAGLGFYRLIDWVLEDLRPRYLETMEESMVDTATLLSSLVATQMDARAIDTHTLQQAFDEAGKRRFSAQIYELTKTRMNMRVYVTDAQGIVVFDSDAGKAEGKDYSRWNDVALTLRGKYGARSTRSDPDDPASSMLHVASPILVDETLAGVLTVCKPAGSVTLFLVKARWKIAKAGITAALAVIILGMLFSFWITRPITQLTQYAQAVRDGKRTALPSLGKGEMETLGTAFEEMRAALEGKQYVEEYVQTLAHQMKSPLSAIQGAAELLEEEMPPEQRRQFLQNLRSESGRLHGLIERMLQLSALENQRELRDVQPTDLGKLCADVAASLAPALSQRQATVTLDAPETLVVEGEPFLLRQAIANLMENAADFSGEHGEIIVQVRKEDSVAEVTISDNGPGIPGYALDKVFDRFYSLPRPATGKKSSGLGLALVRETATLHGGTACIRNRPEGGVAATLTLPLKMTPTRA